MSGVSDENLAEDEESRCVQIVPQGHRSVNTSPLETNAEKTRENEYQEGIVEMKDDDLKRSSRRKLSKQESKQGLQKSHPPFATSSFATSSFATSPFPTSPLPLSGYFCLCFSP